MCSTLSTCQVFSQVLLLYTLFWATAKCNLDRWITHVISTSTAINWVRLARHISKARMVTYHFYCLFRNSAGYRTFRESFKKFIGNFNFWGISLIYLYLELALILIFKGYRSFSVCSLFFGTSGVFHRSRAVLIVKCSWCECRLN